MHETWIEQRSASIVERLEGDGLRTIESDGTNTAYRCRKPRLAPFGFVETLVSLWVVQGTVTPDHLTGHLDAAIALARATRARSPLGLGTVVEVLPITLATHADDSAIVLLAASPPSRMEWMTLSALVHDHGTAVTMYEDSTIWDAAYLPSVRKRLRRWVGGPDARP